MEEENESEGRAEEGRTERDIKARQLTGNDTRLHRAHIYCFFSPPPFFLILGIPFFGFQN